MQRSDVLIAPVWKLNLDILTSNRSATVVILTASFTIFILNVLKTLVSLMVVKTCFVVYTKVYSTIYIDGHCEICL